MNTTDLLNVNPSDIVDVFYTYTPAEDEARRGLIEIIEAEKRAYMERIEPLMQRLTAIQGTPHLVVRNPR